MNKKSTILILIISILCCAKLNFAQTYTMPTGTGTGIQSVCSGVFADNGGTGANYAANCNSTFTICPMVSTDYATITFTAFASQNNKDFLIVYDGNGTGANAIAILTGSPAMPVTYKASAANVSGCLSFVFISDGSTQNAGWSANISCSNTPGPIMPPVANKDCVSKKKVCTTQVFSESNAGAGSFTSELGAANQGCLSSGEAGGLLGGGGSSWYFFTATTTGTVGFDINLGSNTDDYDFGVWGPNPACPPTTAPIRCSFFAPPGAYGYNTGLNGTETDVSENTSGNGYVKRLAVNAGETYIVYVNRYSGSSNGFTMSFNGTAGLDCNGVYGVPLPIDLLSFTAKLDKTQTVVVHWETATEINNNHYEIEKSTDGGLTFNNIGQKAGAGNSSSIRKYDYIDTKVTPGLSVYRLKQVDHNGDFKYSHLAPLYNKSNIGGFVDVHPNPVSAGSSSLSVNFNAVVEATAVVSIKNTIGQELYRKNFALNLGENILDISLDGLNLISGLYFAQVQTPDGSETKRFMISDK